MKKSNCLDLRRYLFTSLFFAMLVLLSFSCSLGEKNAVEKLQINFTTNPIGLDDPTPRFSWRIKSDKRGVMQESYRIIVSTDKQGKSVVWDSEVVNNSQSINVPYTGSALQPNTRYYWNVEIASNKNDKIKSKELAYFETGLLNSGWNDAQWIRHLKKSELNNSDISNFDLEADVTLLSDNIGIIFGASDMGNMHMWSVNTHDHEHPILRRHVYVNGRLNQADISMKEFFTKADLLNKELRVKISVRGNKIETYIDGKLVDTDHDSPLKGDYIGFRAFKSHNLNEHAYIDNIKLTSYASSTSSVTLEEDFEKESNNFDQAETIVVDGNTKLNVYSKNNVFSFLQNSAGEVPMFRTKIDLDKKVEWARIYSSSLGMYDLFVNGERVGRKMENGSVIYDELKPGWTHYLKTVFYTTYDITDQLKKGENAIGAIVTSGWISGAIAHNRYGNPDLGFIAKIMVKYSDGSSDTFVTNTETWVSSNQSAIRKADIYHGEHYDARMESNWNSPGYDDSGWQKTGINTFFKGNITAFIAPPVQIREEMNQTPKTTTIYDGITQTGSTFGEVNVINKLEGKSIINLKKGETAIIDFGQNIVGWIHFKVKGESGTKMRARFSEMLNDSGDRKRGNDNAKGTLYLENLRSAQATLFYTLKGEKAGEKYRPSMTFFGFRYCEITAPQDIIIEEIIAEVVGTVAEEESKLTTCNKSVNQLYSNIIWGQRGNFVSVPTDCPQRDERLGWTGDTQVFCRTAAYNSNVNSFFHKWMGDMRDSQRADGAYPDVAPEPYFGAWGTAGWADAGIIVPWTIYQMYDDKAIIEENYASMEKYMDFLASQKDDKYLYNGPTLNYGDWLAYEQTDRRYLSVCYYANDALLMAEMASALGKTQDVDKYNTLYDNIKKEFQGRYIEEDGTLKQKTQTAYLLALKFDLFPTEQAQKDALDFLLKKIADNGYRLSTGFLGTSVLNQTLSEYNANDMAYNLLLQRNDPSWLYSVDQGATTIWERWNSYTLEKGFGDAGMNSFNHYAYGVVGEWMYRYMAGIDQAKESAGFKHIVLRPIPDTRKFIPENQERITETDATFVSAYGAIKSKWNVSEGSARYEITVPANTMATLYLPQATEGTYVYENKIKADSVEGVSSIKDEGGYFVLELGSGSYLFDVE
ncbi:MAG: glycoside hydrolase family 78 protein [Bacteroidales bacterium]|jgi:alpha-L-rhamnosidase|nr:glycoside hydrolase family 78 protein [Bacteroidales bacterium]